MTDTMANDTIKAGSVITARTSDTAALVWFYVIAVLDDGARVFGVNLGNNASYVSPEGTGIRFDTATVEHYGAADSLTGRLSNDVRGALVSFLVAAGLPDPTAETPRVQGDQDTDQAYQRGVADGRAEEARRFEAWKVSATETAHEYADRNELCGEFDRCMEEIGLEPRSPRVVEVTYRVTVPRTVARDTDFNYLDAEDLYGLDGVDGAGAPYRVNFVD